MLRRVLRLARMLCALMYRQNGDLANLLKSAWKKSAPGCPFECGGGVQSLFGQCPNRGDAKFSGASLTWVGARDTCVSKKVAIQLENTTNIK